MAFTDELPEYETAEFQVYAPDVAVAKVLYPFEPAKRKPTSYTQPKSPVEIDVKEFFWTKCIGMEGVVTISGIRAPNVLKGSTIDS